MADFCVMRVGQEEDRRLVSSWLRLQGAPFDGVCATLPDPSALDRNGDGCIDLADWKRVATPDYPISRRAFFRVAQILAPAFSGALTVAPFPVNDVLDHAGSQIPFERKGSQPLFDCATEEVHRPIPRSVIRKIIDTPKAVLHLHLGGGARIRFLYDQALDRVGPGALAPERWGGRIFWDGERGQRFTDMLDGQKKPVDELIRSAVVGSVMREEAFVPPSRIIAMGQEMRRKIQESADPREKKRLAAAQEENFLQFKRLSTFPSMRQERPLPRFLNFYRISSSLVERSLSAPVLAAAIDDAIEELSRQGVRYVELKFAIPDLATAERAAAGFFGAAAISAAMEPAYAAAISAIREKNRALIEQGRDPVDLRLISALSRNASVNPSDENFLQVQALLELVQRRPDLSHWIVGVDFAAKEAGEPPLLYRRHAELIRQYNTHVRPEQRLGLTWHQGEDFSDTSLFDAIRRIEDLFDLGIDRLGHGLVLGLDPAAFLGAVFRMAPEEYEAFLCYEERNRFSHALLPCLRDVARTADGSGRATVVGRYPPPGSADAETFVAAIRERQLHALGRAKRQGISIEINPTSNLHMTTGTFEQHPLPFLYGAKVPLTINTDDPGIFDRDIAFELVSASLMLGLTEAELSSLVVAGFEQSFAVRVRGECPDCLR